METRDAPTGVKSKSCLTNKARVAKVAAKAKLDALLRADNKTVESKSTLVGIKVTDDLDKCWRIGKFIGDGSFGEVFLGYAEVNKKVHGSANVVIKRELDPENDGSLADEIDCYKAVARKSQLKAAREALNIKWLGIPPYVASGSHLWKGNVHRFLVIPKLGKDLRKLFDRSDQRLPSDVVIAVSLQIVDILDYLSSKGYIHGDIKEENILFDVAATGNEIENPKIYLVDYGMARKFEKHLVPDEKRKGCGTLPVMARHAHHGAYPRSGDLESLGYNMIHWTGGCLPWEKLESEDTVLKVKESFMEKLDLKPLYKYEFEGLHVFKNFLKYVRGLEPKDAPDYYKCRNILWDGMTKDFPLIFGSNPASSDRMQLRSLKRLVHPTAKNKKETSSDPKNPMSTQNRTKLQQGIPTQRGIELNKELTISIARLTPEEIQEWTNKEKRKGLSRQRPLRAAVRDKPAKQGKSVDEPEKFSKEKKRSKLHVPKINGEGTKVEEKSTQTDSSASRPKRIICTRLRLRCVSGNKPFRNNISTQSTEGSEKPLNENLQPNSSDTPQAKTKRSTSKRNKRGIFRRRLWKSKWLVGKTITDDKGERWRIGKFLGAGNFGRVYEVFRMTNGELDNINKFIIKWELKPGTENGFKEEIKFSKKITRKLAIEQRKINNNLDSLGIPAYVASGTHRWYKKDFQFVITSRLGKSLQKFIKDKPDGRLALKVVVAIALQIIEILKYLHVWGIVHNDIKSENILLGMDDPENETEIPKVYLIDYGLSLNHKYRIYPNEDLLDWGTPEYMARDAHKGAYPRRGDLESLAYNLIQWAGGKLPWIDINRKKKQEIFNSKTDFMEHLNLSLVNSSSIEGFSVLEKFLKYVRGLKPEDDPDYEMCRKILRQGLKYNGKRSIDKNLKKGNQVSRKRPLCEDAVSAPAKRQKRRKTENENGEHSVTMNSKHSMKLRKRVHNLNEESTQLSTNVTNFPSRNKKRGTVGKGKEQRSDALKVQAPMLSRKRSRPSEDQSTLPDVPARKRRRPSASVIIDDDTNAKRNNMNENSFHESDMLCQVPIVASKKSDINHRKNSKAEAKTKKKEIKLRQEIVATQKKRLFKEKATPPDISEAKQAQSSFAANNVTSKKSSSTNKVEPSLSIQPLLAQKRKPRNKNRHKKFIGEPEI